MDELYFNIEVTSNLHSIDVKNNSFFTSVIDSWIKQYHQEPKIVNQLNEEYIVSGKELSTLHKLFIKNSELFIKIYNFHKNFDAKDYENILEYKS